jgi:hypothetical protein
MPFIAALSVTHTAMSAFNGQAVIIAEGNTEVPGKRQPPGLPGRAPDGMGEDAHPDADGLQQVRDLSEGRLRLPDGSGSAVSPAEH